MKKIALIIGLLCLMAAGCGKDNGDGTPQTQDSATGSYDDETEWEW